MVYTNTISAEQQASVWYLQTFSEASVPEIFQKWKISKLSVAQMSHKSASTKSLVKRTGRPRKINKRDGCTYLSIKKMAGKKC